MLICILLDSVVDERLEYHIPNAGVSMSAVYFSKLLAKYTLTSDGYK